MRGTIFSVCLAAVLCSSVLAGTAQAATSSRGSASSPAKKAQVFRVSITFTQTRPWTYYHQQVSGPDPICTRTEERNGADTAHITASTLFTYLPGYKSSVGFGIKGTHGRVGAGTSTVAGADCAPSAVFPSTWSIISETGGTVTASEPHNGCGTKQVRISFPTLDLVGKKLRLRWTDTSQPEFNPCPYFEGSNEAQDGHELPGSAYLPITAPISLAALKKASVKRITTSGTAKEAETETCANIQQGCPEGVTYNASASVASSATFVLVRVRR
ncbi:MAG: hypothetical protein QOE36_3668 [Gaiellaceae bacterium]|nr:hypothetical protein [Gaiellaceae bacterium]